MRRAQKRLLSWTPKESQDVHHLATPGSVPSTEQSEVHRWITQTPFHRVGTETQRGEAPAQVKARWIGTRFFNTFLAQQPPHHHPILPALQPLQPAWLNPKQVPSPLSSTAVVQEVAGHTKDTHSVVCQSYTPWTPHQREAKGNFLKVHCLVAFRPNSDLRLIWCYHCHWWHRHHHCWCLLSAYYVSDTVPSHFICNTSFNSPAAL